MADRFPSLEEFDSGATPDATENVASPDEDFLARERAALGDDADNFTTSNDKAAFVDDDDLLGGGSGGQEDFHEFESSFPAVQGNIASPEPTSITGSHPYRPQETEEEPAVIREWRERRDAGLAERAEKSEQKKQETIKAAQENIDEFYENYNNKKEKAIAATRREAEDFLNSREDTSAGGTSWERIAKLVDLSGKGAKGGAAGTGKEKFRELLLSLRKDENAPGASGI